MNISSLRERFCERHACALCVDKAITSIMTNRVQSEQKTNRMWFSLRNVQSIRVFDIRDLNNV